MLDDNNHDHQHISAAHNHDCGNLFGCGEEKGTGIVREDLKDAAVTRRAADRLLHMDEVQKETLDSYLTVRGRSRRRLLQASTFMGALAAVGPWFGKLAHAAAVTSAVVDDKKKAKGDEGQVHEVECSNKTVHLGVFDA